MEHQRRLLGLLVDDVHRQRFAAVRTRRLDPSIAVQCRAHTERIPRAVRVPPASLRENSVGSLDGRERVRHADRAPAGLEDERMRRVQLPPALDDALLGTELARGRRTAELDERRVRPIPEGDQIRVDGANLHSAWSRVARRS